MKILFYSPVQLLAGGGCERWHCDVTASLKKQFNYDIQIVTANLGKPEWTQEYLKQELKVPYEIIEFPIFLGALIPTPMTFLKLLRHFQTADVVHVIQGFIGQDIFILLIKWFTGKKVVVGYHAPIFHKVWLHNLYMKYVTRYLLNFFDGHMTLNGSDKKFLVKSWRIKNVNFIPSGIRVERFLKTKRKDHNFLNFLTVGIYRPQKGMDLLVKAVSLFNKKFPNNKAVFRFVGGGEQKEIIGKFAKNNKNIEDVGYVKYEDMPKLYEESDIYLLSSREEPFGLVLIEGWSSGIPALATKTEGPLDMLMPETNGWFIDEMNTDGILRGIEKLYKRWLKSKKFLEEMENACRATGREYSIDTTAYRMRKFLFE